MLFTKTEIHVLELFASQLTRSFTIREAARLIKKDLKIVHTSIKELEKRHFFLKDEHLHLQLNYKNNLQDLAYIENLCKEKFFKKYHSLRIAFEDFQRKTNFSFFTLLIFGSYAEGSPKKHSDLDLLAIVPEKSKMDPLEKEIRAYFSLLPQPIHLQIILPEEFKSMLQRREELNLANETLNRHIILFGGENYYKLLGGRDVR